MDKQSNFTNPQRFTSFTFKYQTTDCENAIVEMTFSPEGAGHHEITDFYMRFLRACGFVINHAQDPDVNDLGDNLDHLTN